jgi:hypothetical protein
MGNVGKFINPEYYAMRDLVEIATGKSRKNIFD